MRHYIELVWGWLIAKKLWRISDISLASLEEDQQLCDYVANIQNPISCFCDWLIGKCVLFCLLWKVSISVFEGFCNFLRLAHLHMCLRKSVCVCVWECVCVWGEKENVSSQGNFQTIIIALPLLFNWFNGFFDCKQIFIQKSVVIFLLRHFVIIFEIRAETDHCNSVGNDKNTNLMF